MIALICGFLFFRLADNFTKIPDDFCTEGDDLYEELVANGELGAEEIAVIDPFYLDVVTSKGKRLHLIRDEKRLGFYVAVTLVPRSGKGKAGYFYSLSGVLPKFHPDDELTHLEGKIYCYIIAYP